MAYLTKAEVLKETRKIARDLGLTFKVDDTTLNGNKTYVLTNRKTGKVLMSNMTLDTGYHNALNGYFHQFAREEGLLLSTRDTIKKAIKEIGNTYTYDRPLKDSNFINEVSLCLDNKYSINVAATSYAHDVFVEELDNYFD